MDLFRKPSRKAHVIFQVLYELIRFIRILLHDPRRPH